MNTLRTRRYGRRFYPNIHAFEYRKNLFKLQKQSTSRHFLLKCRKFDLMPRFILDKKKTYFQCLQNEDHPFKGLVNKLINTVQRKVLNMTIKICCWRIRKLTKEVSEQKIKLFETCDDMVAESVVEELQDFAMDVRMESKEQLINKFKNLVVKQKKSSLKFDESAVINLTEIIIPEDVTKLLSLGPKVCVAYELNNAPVLKLIADVESYIRRMGVGTEEKDVIRNEISYISSRYMRKNIHQKYEMTVLKEMLVKTEKFLKENKEICFLQADKGKKSVIMNRSEYINKVLELLSDDTTYEPMATDPTKKVTAMIAKLVKRLGSEKHIKDWDVRNILSSNSLPPTLYCLVKTHKSNYPMRPIVSTINSPHSDLAKFLASILKNIVNSEYNLNNSLELKEKLGDIKIPKNHQLISFDVVSLFTNVPIDLVFELIDKNWKEIMKFTDIPLHRFRELLQVVLIDCNYFVFNGSVYKQTFGLPMGSPLAPVLSSIMLDDLVTRSIRKSTYKPKFMFKYVDDFISELDPSKVNYFLNILNSYHEKIQFTYETEQNNVLNYLDMKIIHTENRNNKNLKFDWYQKVISSSRLLNYISHHPETQKRNVASNFIYTVLKISDKEFHEENCSKIKNILNLQNYPTELVKKLIKDRLCLIQKQEELASQRHLRSEPVNMEKTKTKYGYVGVKYIRSLSENVVKVFNNHNIEVNVAHTTGNSLRHMYNTHKEKHDKLKLKDSVYKIKCLGNENETCTKSYVGTTSRSLETRMTEHNRDQHKSLLADSHTALAEHAISNNHLFDTKKPKVLCKEKRWDRRMLLESFNIFTTKDSVNFRQDTEGISKIYKSILGAFQS